ncbi:MAG: hypothetical protein K2X86_06390, partial [Cytophagaceae bacterium]|nr:hypothetical protein [Cytophagaceae bacterium]
MNEEKIRELIRNLSSIITHTQTLEKSFSSEIYSSHPLFRKSARNLLHYLALRNFDIREIQQKLAALGLSSLGRAEAHVYSSLVTVCNQLKLLLKDPLHDNLAEIIPIPDNSGLLDSNIKKLFGIINKERSVRIMVTLSSDTADNYQMVKDLILAGMDCARINCAHDDQQTWIKMIENIRRAKKETGLSCKILMDLAGLKLRTGPVKPGRKILKIKIKKDFFGNFIRPAILWMGPPEINSPSESDVHIPVSAAWISRLKAGDKIKFIDARGKKRKFLI